MSASAITHRMLVDTFYRLNEAEQKQFLIDTLGNVDPTEVQGMIEAAHGPGTKAGEVLYDLRLDDGKSIRLEALVDISSIHPQIDEVLGMGNYLEDPIGMLNYVAKQRGVDELVRFRMYRGGDCID